MRFRTWILVSSLGLVACKPTVEPAPPEPAPAPAPEPEPEARVYPDPPPPSAAATVNFPATAEFTLPNGLTVHVVQSREVPLVSAQLVVRCGTMDRRRVAEFAAAMLGEGTTTRTKAQIDEAIEFVGGSLAASAGIHSTHVMSRVLSQDLKLALTLMADEVMNPVFPADALAKLKEQAKGSLRIARTQSDFLADMLFDQIAYPEGHPYGEPLATEEELDAIALADVKAFHTTFYRANNAFLVLAGDVDVATAKELTTRVFADWSPANAEEIPPNPLNAFKSYDVAKALVVHVVDRPGSSQTEIRVGNLALARGHEDWHELLVANSVLGGDLSSRLFLDVREKRGLVYNIGSVVTPGQAPGTFTVRTRSRTQSSGATLAAVLDHIKTLRSQGVTAEEIAAETEKIVGGFPLELETPEQIAGKVRERLIYNLPADYWSTYRAAITAVTPDDVAEAARKYMHGSPHIVLVGEADAIVAQVAEVLPKAEIRRYDAQLRPLASE